VTAPTAPIDALRLLAGLIAADLRDGSSLLAVPVPPPVAPQRRRGRPKSVPFAVAVAPVAIAA